MQLARSYNDVETGNVIQSGEFGIAKNAKMFHILSDSMYKDKIGSMVRELSSNARDAHVAAGTPELPFIIHLPNAFEPWFSVTDFGPAISPEDIYNVLTVYGVSTKDQSNDAIGAFGLGAKTPFAYTDNFTVRSIYNGVERLYTACIANDGMPTLSLQAENATDLPNGFQITVSVNDSDFSRFKDKVVEQLKFFPVKPTIENCDGFEWVDIDDKVTYTSDLVTMYDGSYGTPIDGLWVTQGGVGYPVDINELQGIDNHTKSFAEALSGKDAVMPFAIGDIDVTAPRENVSYEPVTIANIIKRIAEIAKVMCREVLVDIQKEKSIWNRAVIYNNQISVVQKAIRQSPLFDKLFAGMDKDRHGKLAVNMDDLVALDLKAVNLAKFKSYRSNAAGTTVKRKELGNMSHYGDEYLTAAQEINVFVRDTKSKPMARAKHFVFTNDFPLTIMIEPRLGSPMVETVDKAAIAKALRMPVSNIRLLSELEAPANAPRGSGSEYTAPKAYQWDTSKMNSDSRDWERLYDAIDDIGVAVWVEMDRHNVRWSESNALMFRAAENGCFDYDIIAVNGRTADRIRAGKIGADLITVEEAAVELKARIAAQTSTFVKYARDRAFMEKMSHNSVIMTLVEKGGMSDLEKQVNNIAAKNKELADRIDENRWMQNFIPLDAPVQRGRNRAASVCQEVFDKFPMLKYVEKRFGSLLEDDVLADVQSYIAQTEQVGVDTPA